MIKIVVKQYIKQDQIDNFIELVRELVKKTRELDAGCIEYGLFQDLKNPQILTFIEEWESMEALDQHMAADHFKELVPKLGAFADGPKELHIYKKAY